MPNSCNRNHAESFFVKIFFCSTTIQALFKWPTINQQTELHDFSTTAAHNSNTQQPTTTTTNRRSSTPARQATYPSRQSPLKDETGKKSF